MFVPVTYKEPIQAERPKYDKIMNCPNCQMVEKNCMFHPTIYHYEEGITYMRCLKCGMIEKLRMKYNYVF